MTYCIIWENPSGSVSVTVMPESVTLEETMEHKNALATKTIQTFKGIVTSDDLPQDRYFRNAWRWDNSAIKFDLADCRSRHLDKLRRIRNAKLQDSDPDFMRALEQNDATKLTALKAYRQALRDMPQTSVAEFSNAATPESIRAIRPTILNTTKP